MILVDSSVLIHHLKTPSPVIRETLATAECAVFGVTCAEILCGARSQEDVQSLCRIMDALIPVPTLEASWDHLGIHLAAFRSRGLPMPFQDVLLATVAIDHDCELWSYDAHFRTIQGVLPQLRLFDGPTA